MKRNSVFNRATNNFHFLTHTIGGFTMNKGTQILRSVVLLSFLSLGLMSINTHAALSLFGQQFWQQGADGIKGTAENVDEFGYSLAAGDFDGDGVADLAIGVPFENLNTGDDVGRVNVIYGSSGSGLTGTGDQIWAQGEDGIKGTLETFDQFGYSLAAVVSNGPAENKLMQNMPNPFNPETWIPYQLKDGADVTIEIYNPTGTLVRELNLGHQVSGYYANRSKAVYWDGRNEFGEHVASGVYFYRISAGDYSATKKMVILK